MKSYSI